MSSQSVRQQVDAYLAANWTATEIVSAENEFSKPPEGLAPWLTVLYQGSSEVVPCLGNLAIVRKRELGTVQLIVYVASGTGTDVALQYAEDVRNLMRGWEPGTGLRFREADPPETAIPSQAQSSEGNYYGYAVACPYIYDFT